MTRNVRPSWIELEVEGRKSNIATGPVARNGNMYAKFFVRENGQIINCLNVNFFANGETVKVVIGLDTDFKPNGLFELEKTYNQRSIEV